MIDNPISEKRQKLIDAKNASPLEIGERIAVKYNATTKFKNPEKEKESTNCIILALGKKIKVRYSDNSCDKDTFLINKSDIVSRDLMKIGENPIVEMYDRIRSINYDFNSIISLAELLGKDEDFIRGPYQINGAEISEFSWNPFVYNKEGQKEYYQRPFCWTLNDKQLLIESVYRRIDCGKILVRRRSWEELGAMQAKGETELAFHEIVDGKQRLDAMRGFLLGEYPDTNGNFFADLCFYAQRKFTNHQLFSYMEMPEDSKDEDVIYQFLQLNFCGVPQSPQHLDYVRSIQKKL